MDKEMLYIKNSLFDSPHMQKRIMGILGMGTMQVVARLIQEYQPKTSKRSDKKEKFLGQQESTISW